MTSGVSPSGHSKNCIIPVFHNFFTYLALEVGYLVSPLLFLGYIFLNGAPFTAVKNTKNTHCLSSDPQKCLLGISRYFSLHMHDLTSLRDLIQRQRSIFIFKHPELDPDGISHSNRRQEGLFYQGITALQRLSSQELLCSIKAFMEKTLSLAVYLTRDSVSVLC